MNPKERVACLKNMDPFKALLWFLFEGSNLWFVQVQLWAISSSALKLPPARAASSHVCLHPNTLRSSQVTLNYGQPPGRNLRGSTELCLKRLLLKTHLCHTLCNLGQFTPLFCVTVNGNFCPETKCPIWQVKNIWPWLDVTYSNNGLLCTQDPRRTGEESEIEASLEFLAMGPPFLAEGIMKSFAFLKRHLMMWNYVSESHTRKAIQFWINWLRDYFKRSQKGEKTKNDGFWTETWKL